MLISIACVIICFVAGYRGWDKSTPIQCLAVSTVLSAIGVLIAIAGQYSAFPFVNFIVTVGIWGVIYLVAFAGGRGLSRLVARSAKPKGS